MKKISKPFEAVPVLEDIDKCWALGLSAKLPSRPSKPSFPDPSPS